MKTVLFTLLLVFGLCSAGVCDIVFIGDKHCVPDELAKKDIEAIFLGNQKTWADKTEICLVLFTQPIVFDAFLNEYVGKPKHIYKSYWLRIVFTGRGKAPTGLGEEKLVIEQILKTKGAIGFVTSDYFHSSGPVEGIKVIKISDGKNQK